MQNGYPLNSSLEQNAISLPPSPAATRCKPATSMRFGLNLIPIVVNNPAGINHVRFFFIPARILRTKSETYRGERWQSKTLALGLV